MYFLGQDDIEFRKRSKTMAEQKKSVEATVRNIRRATRKKYTAEEKVRIVL